VAKRKAPNRPSVRRAAALPPPSPIRYIESSALVAALLEADAAARMSIRVPGRRVTSALTIAEATRALFRARLLGRITAQQHRAVILTLQRFIRCCHTVSITEAILNRAARPFPTEPVRTLDALHLATVEALGDFLVVVTRDVRVRDNAAALGYQVE